MIATSINGLLGHSALMIGLVASLFGALALGYATVTNDRRLLRTVPNYAWMAGAAGVLPRALTSNPTQRRTSTPTPPATATSTRPPSARHAG